MFFGYGYLATHDIVLETHEGAERCLDEPKLEIVAEAQQAPMLDGRTDGRTLMHVEERP